MTCNRQRSQPLRIDGGEACPEVKVESRKQKAEMKSGRLPEQFRDRTKAFAAQIIRFFVKLPKTREEVRVVGKQLLRSGTSVAAHARPVK